MNGQRTGTRGPSAAQVGQFLKGVRFPCDKQRIVDMAEHNDAPQDIIEMLANMEDQEFGGIQQVQQALSQSGGYEDDNQQQDRGQQSRRRQGNRDDDNGNQGSQNGQYRAGRDQVAYGESASPDPQFGGFDPNPDEVSSQMRGHQEDDPTFHQYKERYEERGPTSRRSNNDEDAFDHRLRGHETDKLADARHMRHGYDGRGRVTDEENDRRLRGNETQDLYESRRMMRGYDGRGRVRKRGPGTYSNDREQDKNFQGNQNANYQTGRGQSVPLYKKDEEEREQIVQERIHNKGYDQEEQDRDFPQGGQTRRGFGQSSGPRSGPGDRDGEQQGSQQRSQQGNREQQRSQQGNREQQRSQQQQNRLEQYQRSGPQPNRQQQDQQQSNRQNAVEMILNYIEDQDGPCDPNDIFDFMRDNGIRQNGNAILHDLKEQGKIKLTRDGYVPNDGSNRGQSQNRSNQEDDDRIPGGQGRVKDPEHDGRLKQNRDNNDGNRGRSQGNQGRQKDAKRMILSYLDEHEEGASLKDLSQFCQEHGYDGPIGKYLASLRSDGEIDKDEEGNYYIAEQQ